VLGKITYKVILDQNQMSKNDLKSSSKSLTCEVISNKNHSLGEMISNQNHSLTGELISNQNHSLVK